MNCKSLRKNFFSYVHCFGNILYNMLKFCLNSTIIFIDMKIRKANLYICSTGQQNPIDTRLCVLDEDQITFFFFLLLLLSSTQNEIVVLGKESQRNGGQQSLHLSLQAPLPFNFDKGQRYVQSGLSPPLLPSDIAEANVEVRLSNQFDCNPPSRPALWPERLLALPIRRRQCKQSL